MPSDAGGASSGACRGSGPRDQWLIAGVWPAWANGCKDSLSCARPSGASAAPAARMGQHVPGAMGRRVLQPEALARRAVQPRRQQQAARQGHVVQALVPAGRKSRSEPWVFFSLFRRPRGQVPRVQGNTRTRHREARGIRPGIVDRNAVLTRRESTLRPTMLAKLMG